MIDCTKTPSISDNITWTTATTGTVNYIPMSTSTATITTTNIEELQEKIDHINSFTNEEMTLTVKIPEFHPEWNCKPKGLQGSTFSVFDTEPTIVNIDVIVPEKVVEVTIFDGKIHTYKQVCKYPDDFNFKFALALALAKYVNESCSHPYTREGVEALACEYMWKYTDRLKEINRAIKAYNKWLKEESKKEAEEAERQAIIERRRAKNKKRKEKMRARKKQEEISTIAEAIKLAKEN